ncbi:MAG: DUF4834 family protein [Prolixibacteraceae bacterium]|nr:DUF4834 family protein [Prolixibacteraceae bacterium]
MGFIIRLLQPHNKTHSSKKSSETKEGETTIRFNKKGDKIVDKDEGEYVDFEEVD